MQNEKQGELERVHVSVTPALESRRQCAYLTMLGKLNTLLLSSTRPSQP